MRTGYGMMLAAVALVAAPAWADDAVQAPIRAMVKGFNGGDVALARSAHVAAPIILDEPIAPFIWSGPKAFDTWLAALMKSEKAAGKTDGQVAVGPALRENIDGDTAYVVTPSTYTFRQGGRTMRETGTLTFALVRQGAEWKIAAWTWSSPAAVAVN